MKKAMLIVNPTSGGEKAPEYKDQLKEKLNEYFDQVEVLITEAENDATKFAKNASEEKYHSLFVMGGDGTVNEAVAGIADKEYRPKFGFIPMGTVNDLGRSLGISVKPEEAIQNLNLTVTNKLDIGKVNDKYFANAVAVGTIPNSVSTTPIEEKTKFGRFAYVLNGLREFKENKSRVFRMTIDGNTREVASSLITIVTASSVAGFNNFLKEAEPDDGKLNLFYIKDENLFEIIGAVPDIIKGVDGATDNVGYCKFEEGKFEVIGDEELSVSMDGEEGPILPIEIKVLASHLDVYYEK